MRSIVLIGNPALSVGTLKRKERSTILLQIWGLQIIPHIAVKWKPPHSLTHSLELLSSFWSFFYPAGQMGTKTQVKKQCCKSPLSLPMKGKAPACRMYRLYFILESSSWDGWYWWGAQIPAGASLLSGPPERLMCSPGPPKHWGSLD